MKIKDKQIIKGWLYFRAGENFHHNRVLNISIDIVISMFRGMASILDGLVLVLSLGRFATSLGFRSVVYKMKQTGHDTKDVGTWKYLKGFLGRK